MRKRAGIGLPPNDARVRCTHDRISRVLFSRNELDAQRAALRSDPWVSGLSANRANLERFIEYVADQKLIDEPIPVESLFHESVLDT